MEDYWKFIFVTILLLGILGLTHLRPEIQLKENYKEIANIDTSKILIKDQLFLLALENSNQAKIDRISSSYKEDSVEKQLVINTLTKILEDDKLLVDSISQLKNNESFQFKEEFYLLKNNRLNTWLIILIVLFSGILGGFARTKYHLIESLNENFKKVEDKSEEIKSIAPTLQINRAVLEIDNLNKEILTFKEGLEDLKNEDNESITANIVFGIIASSVSFLALTTFSSKVLDFQSQIDYFIFLGWCLLGAVYAKSWIKTLYNRITSSET